MKSFLVAMAAIAILQSSALANGGGGTKQKPTITVRNGASVVAAVIINPSDELITAVQNANTTQEELQDLFQAEGGVFLNTNEEKKFRVHRGDNTVYAVLLTEEGEIDTTLTQTISVGRGAKVRLVIEEDGTGGFELNQD